MLWNLENIRKLEDKDVRARLEAELEKPSAAPLTGSLNYWKRIVRQSKTDHRRYPSHYQIGRGQQGVLSVEPYKSEILPFWKFKTELDALVSADSILTLFCEYIEQDDFVGADMAKKFLHMGFTRARRYANHGSGRKYSSDGSVLPQNSDWEDSEKARSAEVFFGYWTYAKDDSHYLALKREFLDR